MRSCRSHQTSFGHSNIIVIHCTLSFGPCLIKCNLLIWSKHCLKKTHKNCHLESLGDIRWWHCWCELNVKIVRCHLHSELLPHVQIQPMFQGSKTDRWMTNSESPFKPIPNSDVLRLHQMSSQYRALPWILNQCVINVICLTRFGRVKNPWHRYLQGKDRMMKCAFSLFLVSEVTRSDTPLTGLHMKNVPYHLLHSETILV